MEDTRSELNGRIAQRVRDLRASRGLSLDAMATRSGVSRSMISLIERGECSATAVVLDKLAASLNVTLASLFEAPDGASKQRRSPIARRDDQPVWRDPASGYVRRNVSPQHSGQPMQIVEVRFPSGKRVSFDTGARETRTFQQIWVLDGAIDVTVDKQRHRLRTGDCLSMELGEMTMFHNPTRKTSRYAVVIAGENLGRRR
jgi:transcriptional regulator with XRE-family HTH domain